MHGIKDIIFKYHPGFFSNEHPEIVIKISETRVSYQEIYNLGMGKIKKGPLWKSRSDSSKFYDLTASICHALNANCPCICDGDGTEVIAVLDNGKRVTKYIPLSFKESGIGALNNDILEFLSGLKLPPFLK